MFIMQVLANQLHFLANRNAELAFTPLNWPIIKLHCIKLLGEVTGFSYYEFCVSHTKPSPLLTIINYDLLKLFLM